MESERIKTTISVIVPIFNEATTIVSLLNYLKKAGTSNAILETIVVDGGSTDNSLFLIANRTDITIIRSDKGRARQMNTGAQNAKGTVLYFLHADSYPPIGFDDEILLKIEAGKKAGCFRMKFDSNHWWLILMSLFTQLNSKRCRGGDQSLFVTKDIFLELGGFDEKYTIYEDNDFTNRLYDTVGFTVIQKWLTTASRLYKKQGVFKLQFHFMVIHYKKRTGANPESLYAYYCKYIKNTDLSQSQIHDHHS